MFTLLALNPPTRAKRSTRKKKKVKMAKRRRSRKKVSKARQSRPRARSKAGARKRKGLTKKQRTALAAGRYLAAGARRVAKGKRGRRGTYASYTRHWSLSKFSSAAKKRAGKAKKGKRYMIGAVRGKPLSALQKSRLSMAGIATGRSLNPRRKRRNPSVKGVVATGTGLVKKVFSLGTLKVGASAAAGMIVARIGPRYLAMIPGVDYLGRFKSPVLGALSVYGAAYLAKFFKLDGAVITPLVAGGLGVVAIDVAKSLGVDKLLPLGAGRASGPKTGTAGLGDIVTPSQLVNQEAIYGGMGDFLQLSGMGGPVSPTLFAGGLNDFVDFSSPEAGNIAAIQSAAQATWSPGNEGFTAGGY